MLPTVVTPYFKRRKPIYKELFKELKNKISDLTDKIPSDKQPQDSLEEFVIFLFTAEKFCPLTLEQKYKYTYNILMFIRLIKEIVENDLIADTLQETCKKMRINYEYLRGNQGEYFNRIESERTLAHNKAFLENKSLEYPLFEESDLVYKYSEWRQFAPSQKLFDHKMNEIKKHLWNSENFVERITHDVLKEMYYIYYAIYESYFALSIIKNGKEKYPTLYLKENESVLKYLQKTEGLNAEKPDHKQYKNSGLLFRKPNGFEYHNITKLAELLVNNNYITHENISIFVSLFFDNEATQKSGKIIIWNHNKYTLQLLFLELYCGGKVPRGTWGKVAKHFNCNGYMYQRESISNFSKVKLKDKLTDDEKTKIKNIVKSAKN